MNQQEIKNAVEIFYPSLALDRVLSRETRREIMKVLDWAVIVFSILFLLGKASALNALPIFQDTPVLHFLAVWREAFLGGLLMVLALWLFTRALKAFYDSYYFIGVQTVLPETGLADLKPLVTFEAAEVLYDFFRGGDLTKAFAYSSLGRRALFRVGVGKQPLARFFSGRSAVLNHDDFSIKPRLENEPINFGDVASAVVNADIPFYKFLTEMSVSPKDLIGATAWLERLTIYFRAPERFWSKDYLGRISGVGKDWAYGGAYTLEKFARDITERGASEQMGVARRAEVNSLEAILARSGEANALLVADEGAGAMDVVFVLGGRISRGSVLPPLEHKRLYLFDSNAFTAFAKDKTKFEFEFLHILNESVLAGNIILVISDLPNFIESAKSLGSDLVALMDSYLARPDFQVIALSNPGAFHQSLEGDSKIIHRFEKILVKEGDQESIMRSLEDQAIQEETKSQVFFTYQSLVAIAEGTKRYFTEGVGSDQAFHLLSELAPAVLANKKTIVERSDALALIEAKTGISTGEIKTLERDKLLNLEAILHERIIGQDEAVKSISNAMRRARSDIENPERPMGSFLFLGPTGVGKTETTKALASVFFGKEESVIRFDMSEYQGDDALSRLIGSFGSGKQGVLSSRLREQPYGVLLLDEFEKTNAEVLNLFLQILDEGFFSDMTGKRVNARNLIIIATSNAGSDLIWNLLREGKDLVASKDIIVNEIINRGIFKPELLNRFDGVILFHPLSTENLEKIAGLMLKKLQKRLTEKGIELVINDVLLKVVLSAGTDPQFGARPMNRAIAEKVEQVIARKIIAGEAPAGSRIELTEAELV